MDSDVLTVSLGSWMELPNLKLSELVGNEDVGKRVNVTLVAEYYQEYVKLMGLSKNFVNRAQVTRVRKVPHHCHRRSVCGDGVKKAVMKSVPNLLEGDHYSKKETSPEVTDDEVFNFSEEPDNMSFGFDSASSMAVSSGSSFASSSYQEEDDCCDDAFTLSATPMGRLLREQAKRWSKERCCLKVNDVCCESAQTINCIWNPIVNPSLFNSASYSSSPQLLTTSLRPNYR